MSARDETQRPTALTCLPPSHQTNWFLGIPSSHRFFGVPADLLARVGRADRSVERMTLNLDFGSLRLTFFSEFRRLTLAVKAAGVPPAERQPADGHLCGQRGDGATHHGPLASAPASVARQGLRVLPAAVQSWPGSVHVPVLWQALAMGLNRAIAPPNAPRPTSGRFFVGRGASSPKFARRGWFAGPLTNCRLPAAIRCKLATPC